MPTLPFTINAGDATPIDIAFSGSNAGTHSGRITLWCDDPLASAIALPVTVNVAPGASTVVRAMPDHITFYASPAIFVNGPAITHNWLIEALGAHGGTLQSLTIVGMDADLVTAAKQGSPTAPFDQCVILITLNPARIGQLEAMVVAAISDSGAIYHVAVPVRADVQPALQAVLLMALQNLIFSDGRNGRTTVQNFTVLSFGAIDLTISAATISGPDAALFAFETTLPLTIPVGQSANISIAFSPISDGLKSGTLTLTSNAPTVTAQLVGFGTSPELMVMPPNASFTSNDPQRVATTVSSYGTVLFAISHIDVTGPFSIVAPNITGGGPITGLKLV